MSLLSLILALVLIGVLMYLINVYVPMESRIKSILNIVVIVAIVLWLLQAFGLLDSIRGIRIGQ
jgi:hypothetical protein